MGKLYILEEPIEIILSPEASGIALTGAIDIFAFGKAQHLMKSKNEFDPQACVLSRLLRLS